MCVCVNANCILYIRDAEGEERKGLRLVLSTLHQHSSQLRPLPLLALARTSIPLDVVAHCFDEHPNRHHEPDPVDDHPEVDEKEIERRERRHAGGLAERLHVETPGEIVWQDEHQRAVGRLLGRGDSVSV